MHLTDVLRSDMVWPTLEAQSKPDVIRELAQHIAAMEPLDAARVAEILMERERLGSTGIQDGIAIPHGKVPGLDHIVIACGRSPSGINFDAHDGKPTHLFFVLLAPENATGQHLKVLARLSRLLKDAHVREGLLEAPSGGAMFETLATEDQKI